MLHNEVPHDLLCHYLLPLACVPTLQDYDRIFSAYSQANLDAMDLWTRDLR